MENANEQDQSMEDILKTIRNVISGEAGSDEEEEEILELTEMVTDEEAAVDSNPDGSTGDVLDNIDAILNEGDEVPAEENHDDAPDGNHHEESVEAHGEDGLFEDEAPPIILPIPSPPQEESAKHNRLISEANATVSSEILKSLVKTVSKPHTDGFSFRSGMTVEDLVIEIVKPQLSEWLNQHLPSLVKHIVEKEVQKLIPRDDD
jgi:cell pole-organizing protein PopZ